ncbi:hypothetical protein VDGD_20651 [Verticillium dahliae]|nr:hypothetical protein VDGD_20651 [Verticillium dahliae]
MIYLLRQQVPPPVDLDLLVLATADDAPRGIPRNVKDLDALAAEGRPAAAERLARDGVDGLADAAATGGGAALVARGGPHAAQVPDLAGAVVAGRDERVVVVRGRGEGRDHVGVAAEGEDRRLGGGGAGVEEGDVAGGRGGGDEGVGAARQRREGEERVQRRQRRDDARRRQVERAERVVGRRRVGDRRVRRVEGGRRRRGVAVRGDERERRLLRHRHRRGDARALGRVRCRYVLGVGVGGLLRREPEANGAVVGRRQQPLRGAVGREAVDLLLVPVQLERRLELARQPVRCLGVLPDDNLLVETGGCDLCRAQELGRREHLGVTATARRRRGGQRRAGPVPYPDETVVAGGEDAVLALDQVVARPAAGGRGGREDIDRGNPVVMLERGLVCGRQQGANVL